MSAAMADVSSRTDTRDWSDEATNKVVDLVERVRSSTTGPLLKVARGIVYGIVAAVLGITLVVVALIALVRVLDLLPGGVWLAYLILGVVLTLAGMIAWSRRSR